jgi:hypothetical protein
MWALGTNNPTATLFISSSADYGNSLVVNTAWPSIRLGQSSSTGRDWCILNGATGAGIGQGNFGIFDITAGTYRFCINSSGYAGIGTNSPNTYLCVGPNGGVNQSGNLPGISMTSSSGQNMAFSVGQGTAGTNNLLMAWIYNATAGSGYGQLSCYGGNNPLVLQSAGGNVGIGTNSPGYSLDVNGITRSAGMINTSPAYYIGYTTTNPTIYQSNGTNNTSGTLYNGVYNYVAFPTYSQTPSGFITTTGGKYTVAYSGIYAITFTTGTATSNNAQLETFIAKNQYNNSTDLNQPGSGTLASSYHPASTAQWCFSWTGYLSNTDFFTVGFYTSATSGYLGSRTTLSVTLVHRTA